MASKMLSKESLHHFISLNKEIKNLMYWHRRGDVYCYLCDPEKGKKGHGEWNCFHYSDPINVRNHLITENLCQACVIPSHAHDEGCSMQNIFVCNRGDCCRRCGEMDHVFWTCNGRSHPGTQFKTTKKDQTTRSDKERYTINNETNEQSCKNENNFEERDMKSNIENENLNRSQSCIPTESAPPNIDAKFISLGNKFESILNEKIESVKILMNNMQESISQEATENKTLIESILSQNVFIDGKYQEGQISVLDQNTQEAIKFLQGKIQEKDNFIETLENKIENLNKEKEKLNHLHQHLNQEMLGFKETISQRNKCYEKQKEQNATYQQDVEVFIGLISKLFPQLKEMDPGLDNSSVLKIIEKLIEDHIRVNSDIKLELENLKQELSKDKEMGKPSQILSNGNDKEILALKSEITESDKEIVCLKSEVGELKSMIRKYDDYNVSTRKKMESLEERIKEKQEDNEEYEQMIHSLNYQMKLKALEEMNLEENEFEIEKGKQPKEETKDSDLENENITDSIMEGAEDFNESAQSFTDTEESKNDETYDHGYDDENYDENFDENFDENYDDENYDYENHDYENNDYFDEEYGEHNQHDDNFYKENNDCAEKDGDALEEEKITNLLSLKVLTKKGDRITIAEVMESLNEEERDEVVDLLVDHDKNHYEALIFYGHIKDTGR